MHEHGPLYTSVPCVMIDEGGWCGWCCGVVVWVMVCGRDFSGRAHVHVFVVSHSFHTVQQNLKDVRKRERERGTGKHCQALSLLFMCIKIYIYIYIRVFVCVCPHVFEHMWTCCRYTRRRFECTHGGRSESTHGSFQRATPHRTPHTPATYTRHNLHTHNTTATETERERERERETR